MASSSGSDAIRYDLNSDSRVFLCRHCENHVLSSNNFLDVIVTPGTSRILCREPVNVRGQLPAMPFSHCKLSIRQPPGWPANAFYPSPAVNVLCKQCNKYLGETLVSSWRLLCLSFALLSVINLVFIF
ncbi:hypothetical protein ES288_A13G150100v1 [Gossypium darwinii]|uniref:Yippee domain-containing protein n=2 Tax=Gossypium darwinii TaxID=34276 RepID=A0A5D2DZN7_GOSDA|nr:hypothetical protein ES288_A13G150100v1 [Gossypium darwinii]